MAELIQALQSTSVPTILVLAGIITIFLALGARFAPMEIPQNRRLIFGIIGSLFLFVGIMLFAWNPQNVTISNQPTSTSTSESLPTQTATRTIVSSPDPTASSTVTPQIEPEDTATPTSSPIPIPTNTTTPTPTTTPVITEIIVIETITTNVPVFYGPSDENDKAGFLKFGERVEAIGKVLGGSWIEVVLENGQVGWVEANNIQFVQGTVDALLQTWPRTASGTSVSSSGGTCGLKAFTFEDVVGTVWVRWQDLPQGTAWLELSITAPLDGEQIELLEKQDIDASDADTAAKGFELGTWRFDPDDPNWKGFPEDTTYQFVLAAQDAARTPLCTVQGEFIR